MKLGNMVFMVDDERPRNNWSRGVITGFFPGKDGIIRVVDVTCYDASGDNRVVRRQPFIKCIQLWMDFS